MVPVWGYSINKVRTEIPKARMPLLGIGAAFSFLGMMFNVPLPGGTTGHAAGIFEEFSQGRKDIDYYHT